MNFCHGTRMPCTPGRKAIRKNQLCRGGKSCLDAKEWMASIMPLYVSLFSLVVLLCACVQTEGDYGFRIQAVLVSPGYQKIAARYRQDLRLSSDAVEALEHGVPLTMQLQLELRDANTLMLLADENLRFVIRYLPLIQHYELAGPGDGDIRTFVRLRHALKELANVELDFRTGPLAPGSYEFRARTRLENTRLPAPMRLPALFSDQWQHDSEWSTWPFDISA